MLVCLLTLDSFDAGKMRCSVIKQRVGCLQLVQARELAAHEHFSAVSQAPLQLQQCLWLLSAEKEEEADASRDERG